jgi:hypothetical protein
MLERLPFFSMPRQCPLNAPDVDGNPILLRHAQWQLGRAQFRLGFQRLQYKG